jgi:murein DD-endopeptidase MepM/ murein hydrolase activator NlpD
MLRIWHLGRAVFFATSLLVVGAFGHLPETISANQACEATCDQEEDGAKRICLQDKISCWQTMLANAQKEKGSLANTISILNGQIQLQQSEINQTQVEISILEKEVNELGTRIDGLNVSLDRLTTMLIQRTREQYKQQRQTVSAIANPAASVSQIVQLQRYSAISNAQTVQVMERAESQRLRFDEQKTIKEEAQAKIEAKKKQLEEQQRKLSDSRKQHQSLLQSTTLDEKRFQQMVAQARSEYQAIEAILGNRGVEVSSGRVLEGQVIAHVISGASCNSSGTHLHFSVKDSENRSVNPFSMLSSIDNYSNCTGAGSCDPRDPFNPSGSWRWPMLEPIRLTQGYGHSWAVQNTWVRKIYSFHDGIDFSSSTSLAVYAVADGELYRGSYSTGCSLNYVKIVHDNGYSSYYLHVRY